MAQPTERARKLVDQSEAMEADLPWRLVAASLFVLLAARHPPAPVAAASLPAFWAAEAVGLDAGRRVRRGVTRWNAWALHLAAFGLGVAFVAPAVALLRAGGGVATAMGACALGAGLIHCILVRSIRLSVGAVTALPIVAAQLVVLVEVVATAAAGPAEMATGLGVIALALVYIVKSHLGMSAVHDRLNEAWAASRAKDGVLAAVSHELRTPLNAICGAAELLESDPDPAERAERVRLVRRSARTLAALVDEMLERAGRDAGWRPSAPDATATGAALGEASPGEAAAAPSAPAPAPAEAPPVGMARRPAEGAADRAAPLRSVLIVDDAPSNRYVLRAFLRPLGVRVVEAADGHEALDHLAREDFDLVLLDLRMPGMDGRATLRALRRMGGRAAATPVVLVTADTGPGEGARHLALGAQGYLAKPVSRDALLAEIERVRAAAPAIA